MMTHVQAALAFAGIFGLCSIFIFRWALTLHSVPGSWMIGVSFLFAVAFVFEMGVAVGLAWNS